MNASTLRKFALPALLLGTLALTGCAGMQVGPGTTTGAVVGGAASILNGDGGRAAIIGTGIGAAVDIFNGQQPIEVGTHRGARYYDDDRYYNDDRYYDDDRYYNDDRYYDDDRYYNDDRYYRPAPPPPPRRYQPRRYYDDRCGCYYSH